MQDPVNSMLPLSPEERAAREQLLHEVMDELELAEAMDILMTRASTGPVH